MRYLFLTSVKLRAACHAATWLARSRVPFSCLEAGVGGSGGDLRRDLRKYAHGETGGSIAGLAEAFLARWIDEIRFARLGIGGLSQCSCSFRFFIHPNRCEADFLHPVGCRVAVPLNGGSLPTSLLLSYLIVAFPWTSGRNQFLHVCLFV